MGEKLLIWAGSAAEALYYAVHHNIEKDDYRYVFSLEGLRGRHGQSIVKVGTYYKNKDTWLIEQMIDDELGEVI